VKVFFGVIPYNPFEGTRCRQNNVYYKSALKVPNHGNDKLPRDNVKQWIKERKQLFSTSFYGFILLKVVLMTRILSAVC
jgi:hypothetical protein